MQEQGTSTTQYSPIKTVEDMKGLKIRTTQSQLIVDMVEALGASATPMAFGEDL